jgi:hypothetical protein
MRRRLVCASLLASGAFAALFAAGHPVAAGSASRAATTTFPAPTTTFPAPTTLVSTTQQITAFAQDGGRLAWTDVDARYRARVQILTLRTGRIVKIRMCHGSDCHADVFDQFALAGPRALWETAIGGLTETAFYVKTAALGDRRARTIDSFVIGRAEGVPGRIPPLAGRGGLLVYWENSSTAAFAPGSERRQGTAGVVKRIVGRRPTRLFASGPLADIALDRKRIVVLRFAAAGGLVEVRNDKGALLKRFRSKGRPLAVASSGAVVAVLSATGRRHQIRLFSPASGASRGTIGVPASTTPELAASGRWIAFRTAEAVKVVNTGTRRVSVVARARMRGLYPMLATISTTGHRLAWVEAFHRGSRIRAITLPSR